MTLNFTNFPWWAATVKYERRSANRLQMTTQIRMHEILTWQPVLFITEPHLSQQWAQYLKVPIIKIFGLLQQPHNNLSFNVSIICAVFIIKVNFQGTKQVKVTSPYTHGVPASVLSHFHTALTYSLSSVMLFTGSVRILMVLPSGDTFRNYSQLLTVISSSVCSLFTDFILSLGITLI